MKIFLILFFISYPLISQVQIETHKWEKADIRYAKNSDGLEALHSSIDQNISGSIVKSLASAYWFFISDLDGDNCPFRPSCSRFFIKAVSETNLVQGALMFADRFTRDLNVFNRLNKYPRTSSSYLYDPISLYTLDESKIKYFPPQTYFHVE
jgi:putative component of membrane protein insertase Oxa1/YidC/SpoIIIJ protein YidD